MRRKVGPGVHVGPHFGGRGGRSESAMVPFERAKVVSCNCDHCAICNIRPQFAIECLRRSNQQGHFWGKIWGGCKPNLNAVWKRYRDVICKRNAVDIVCLFSTVHKRDRHCQTGHGMVTSIPF